MTRKLTDEEERSIRGWELMAERFDAEGREKEARSCHQHAKDIRRVLEQGYDSAWQVFHHRSDEAIRYMPYKTLNRNGIEIGIHDDDISPSQKRLLKQLGKTIEDTDVQPEGITVVSHNQEVKPISLIRGRGRQGGQPIAAAVYSMDNAEEFAVYVPSADVAYHLRRSMLKSGTFTANIKGRSATVAGIHATRFVLDRTNCDSDVEIAYGVTIRDIWNAVHQC